NYYCASYGNGNTWVF
nr:immunoglobulin light chain junction region [Macaca mulatta]MOX77935.1 immunoglobulin light chain junction region [Macaca mulatta]MOX79358.1 immunoglobulin light chain junction region [Macaca mulatta]MOX81014.1 immunoglobulin light chain junction region [Macaca mulatta]MOX82218.1 immunoglobulin light chain junction region [Macaca mulatta]